MAALAVIILVLLALPARAQQESLFPIIVHPAIFKGLSYGWRVAERYELALCIHGTVDADEKTIRRVVITHLTLPWIEPDSVQPSTIRGIRCLEREWLGLAHTHKSEQVPLPDRCMLSALDAAANAGKLQIVICAEDLMSIWWPIGTGVLCRFDPRAQEPRCRPWGDAQR